MAAHAKRIWILASIALVGAAAIVVVVLTQAGDSNKTAPATSPAPSPTYKLGSWCSHHASSQWCQSPLPAHITEAPPSGPEISAAASSVFGLLASPTP